MALKKTGGEYFIHNDEAEKEGLKKDPYHLTGYYYFAKYFECPSCAHKYHIYLDQYEAYTFLKNARPNIDRRPLLAKLMSKIPHVRLVVEKGIDKNPRWEYYRVYEGKNRTQ